MKIGSGFSQKLKELLISDVRRCLRYAVEKELKIDPAFCKVISATPCINRICPIIWHQLPDLIVKIASEGKIGYMSFRDDVIRDRPAAEVGICKC